MPWPLCPATEGSVRHKIPTRPRGRPGRPLRSGSREGGRTDEPPAAGERALIVSVNRYNREAVRPSRGHRQERVALGLEEDVIVRQVHRAREIGRDGDDRTAVVQPRPAEVLEEGSRGLDGVRYPLL